MPTSTLTSPTTPHTQTLTQGRQTAPTDPGCGSDGYSNASIAEVASNVGLTLPGLLHYFPSKTDMLLAVLEVRDQRSPRLPDYPRD